MRFLAIVLLLVIISFESVQAQSFYASRRKMEKTLIASFGLNTSTYYGDLKPPSDYMDLKPSLSLGASYYFNERFGARAEFSWVTLSGDDADSGEKDKEQRNLSFKSSNFEFAAVGIVNLLPRVYYYQRPRFNGYAFAGIGALRFNPKAELNGKTYELQPLQTEGVDYSRVTMIIPYGLGVRYFVNYYLNINLEFGWRKTFTDYIDDVSTEHVDNASFSDPIAQALADRRPEIGLPVAPAGAKRGDPSKKDAYMLFSIKGEYYISKFFDSNRKLYNRKRKAYYRQR
jgi:hypothetical protein